MTSLIRPSSPGVQRRPPRPTHLRNLATWILRSDGSAGGLFRRPQTSRGFQPAPSMNFGAAGVYSTKDTPLRTRASHLTKITVDISCEYRKFSIDRNKT